MKEVLGKNIVVAKGALRDPEFASKNVNVVYGFKVTGKVRPDFPPLNLQLVLVCAEGVTFGESDATQYTHAATLANDESAGFYVTFHPGELGVGKVKLAELVVSYLDPNGKEIMNETYDADLTIVRNPALVGNKESELFEGLEEVT